MIDRIGCDPTNLSKAIRLLLARGYIGEEINPSDRRKRTYRVIYEPEDSWPTHQPSPNNDWSIGQGSPAKPVGQMTKDRRELVGGNLKVVGHGRGLSDENPRRNQDQYIDLRSERDSDESGLTDAAEAARLEQARPTVNMTDLKGVHAYLATIERTFREARTAINRDAWCRHLAWIDEIGENSECGETHHHWAQRLGEEIALWLDDAAAAQRVAGAAR